MRRSIRIAASAVVASLVAAASAAGTAAVPSPLERPAAARSTGDAQFAALTPTQQATVLNPLRRLATAAATTGVRRWSSTYSSFSIDAVGRMVTVRLSDSSARAGFPAAVHAADPNADVSRLRVLPARYSRRTLLAALRRYAGGVRPDQVRSISPALDGSGLAVEVAPAAATNPPAAGTATARTATAGGGLTVAVPGGARGDVTVPVAITTGPARTVKSTSWGAVKWRDTAPFIGGDLLTPNGANYCTAGLPAVRQSDGHPIMITAGHCFGVGTKVYTGAGPTWHLGDRQVGNYVGTVTARSKTWDSATIDGANNNADESDTNTWLPLTSTAYSYAGDYVCQDGALSFDYGHPTPCGIKVTNPDLWFRIDGYLARGVEGVDVAHGWGSHNGDSGATVFAVLDATHRQARGIVSSGGADGTPDQKRVDWIEAPDIFAALHLRLNPAT
jgi:hypothetical protein